jgi:hypothetical protein
VGPLLPGHLHQAADSSSDFPGLIPPLQASPDVALPGGSEASSALAGGHCILCTKVTSSHSDRHGALRKQQVQVRTRQHQHSPTCLHPLVDDVTCKLSYLHTPLLPGEAVRIWQKMSSNGFLVSMVTAITQATSHILVVVQLMKWSSGHVSLVVTAFDLVCMSPSGSCTIWLALILDVLWCMACIAVCLVLEKQIWAGWMLLRSLLLHCRTSCPATVTLGIVCCCKA